MAELLPLADLGFKDELVANDAPGKKGDLEWIAIGKLFIDRTYQREIGHAGRKNIRKIVEEFTWHLFSPLIVSPRGNGRYAIIDGQHRAIAAKLHGEIRELPCFVMHCSIEDEALAFATINGNVTKVSSQYLFRARLAAGERGAVNANRAAVNAGVRIHTCPQSAAAIKFNETQAPSTIETCVERFGITVTTAALRLIVEGSAEQRGCLRSGAIVGFAEMLKDRPQWIRRIDELAAALKRYGLPRLVNECMAKDHNDSGQKGFLRTQIQRRAAELIMNYLAQAKAAA